jgi:cyanophycinase-like exopeptidase
MKATSARRAHPEVPYDDSRKPLGGGPGRVLALRRHYKGGFFTMIRGGLSAPARMVLVRIASPRASMVDARKVLEECHMVFVSGGDVERGIDVLNDRGIAEPLRALAARGKPKFGSSAGSIMLGREWGRGLETERWTGK